MRFLVDMPLSPALAEWLRNHGHDAIHAIEQGLNRAPDGEILSRAEQQQRTIVTADLDYPRLLAITRATAPGLILFRSVRLERCRGDRADEHGVGELCRSGDYAEHCRCGATPHTKTQVAACVGDRS